MLDYPSEQTKQAFWNQVNEYDITYVLIAPPIDMNWEPNFGKQLDPYVENTLLPLISKHPEQFELIYEIPAEKYSIYKIISPSE